MEPKELDKPDQAVADSAAGQPAQPGRSYAGILVHHGAAPYKHDPTNQSSYYVTLETPDGSQTLWGAGLEQAMHDTTAQRGEPVLMDYQGDAWVARSIDATALPAYNVEAGGMSAGQPPHASQAQGSPDFDASVFDAIMKVAGELKPEGASLDPEEVRRINATLHESDTANAADAPNRQARERNAAETLLQGSAELVGGVASLTGAAMQGLGKGASALASTLRAGTSKQPEEAAAAQPATQEQPAAAGESAFAEELAGRVQVLPRLSEYRVDQVEKAASNYEKAHQAFWNAGELPQVREQIEARAVQTGLTVPEVVEKMKPDGEFTDLHEAFVEAVGQSPDAQASKKAMDKALTGWARQYGRAQEELLNPETEGSPHYDKLKNRLENSSESMHHNAGNTPAFAGESQSHLERLQDAMQRIFERLKEMVQGIVSLVRGKPSGSSQDNGFTP